MGKASLFFATIFLICYCSSGLPIVDPPISSTQSCTFVGKDGDRRIIEHGSSVAQDSCTTCTCNNGLFACATQTCPACPQGSTPAGLQEGVCCPECVPVEEEEKDAGLPVVDPPFSLSQSCTFVGKDGDRRIIEHGSSVAQDSCTTCTCNNGLFACATQICPACPQGSTPAGLQEGVCCPECVPVEEEGKDAEKKEGEEKEEEGEKGGDVQPEVPFGRQSCRVSVTKSIEHGEIITRDICTKCQCDDGLLACFRKTCPVCPNGYAKKQSIGRCCLKCKAVDIQGTTPQTPTKLQSALLQREQVKNQLLGIWAKYTGSQSQS